MAYLGIDIGSLSCDAVILDDIGNILASAVVPTGAKNIEAIERATREVLDLAGISKDQIRSTVSTGYGRDRVAERSAAVTEITCHAKGILKFYPQTNILIDIGGQDSKVIQIGPKGKVMDFSMNDKCAAGTGRFLEAMARTLEVDLEDMAQLDQGAQGKVTISSMCTVFAESEVVSLIAQGAEIREIVFGLNRSIGSRTNSLAKRFLSTNGENHLAMSGGVARNQGVVRALGGLFGKEILVPEQPDIIGALGAALIAMENDQENS